MEIAKKELEEVINGLFKSPMVPWDKIKIVEIDWKQMEVGKTGIQTGKFFSDLVAVPVIKITMKD